MIEGHNLIKIGKCKIHATAKICAGSVIGKPFRKLLDGTYEETSETVIAGDTYIGYYSIIGSSSKIESHAIIDDYCVIESRVTIGKGSLLIYRAQVCNDAQIGNDCVIGGFVAERVKIGNRCRVFGKVIHLQHDPSLGWDDDDAEEVSPVIKDSAFVGFGAVVSGDVTIGEGAFVCANALVTKDVPDFHIASKINQIVHFSKWNGRLCKSPFFSKEHE